jgi:uncharacterized protein
MEIEPILILIILTSLVQSVIGVGILVIGTPFLLILDFHITDVIANLLPLSILTNFINLILQNKSFYKNKDKILTRLNFFFFYCVPSILIGTAILKIIDDQISLNFFVGLVILISIFLKMTQNLKFLKDSNRFFMFLIGLIHGLTNSGGTLLSVSLINQEENNQVTRINIHFFYFLLASVQLIFFIFFFGVSKMIVFNYFFEFFSIILILSLLGNYLSRKISFKFFNSIIIFMAIIASLFLIFKSTII